jgi:GT2 family glycosyltransferase
MNPTLSIVFLNYNRVSETRHTLEQLQPFVRHRADIEIIAVDNASSDGTREYLHTQSDWIRIVEMDDNTGIAGYNQGFELAQGKYLLVLDDDSYPKNPETLDRLIQHLDEQPQTGVVACRVEDPEENAVSSWHLPPVDTAATSMSFIGCGFAIRRDLFQKIGWYPADFFLYQNEVDVSIQVRRAGFEIEYCPDCTVVHRGKPSDRPNWRRVYYPTRNTIWLIRRYFPYPSAAYLIASRLLIGLIRAVQSRELGWYFKAVREAFSHPVPAQPLPLALQKQFAPFFKQNSLWHQMIRDL